MNAPTHSPRPFWPYIALLALVGAAFGITLKTTDVHADAVAGLSMELPDQIGVWKGTAAPVQPIEREYLGADTEFSRKVYRDPDGKEIFLGIVLSGRDRSSIHAAEACLVGQGWRINHGDIFRVPIQKPKPYLLDIMRLNTSREVKTPQGNLEVRNWYMYWFVGKTRLTPKHLNRILWTAFDRIFWNVHHRWAYVTVSVRISSGNEKETEAWVREFIQEAVPTFQKVTG